jgi:hypothetical protein
VVTGTSHCGWRSSGARVPGAEAAAPGRRRGVGPLVWNPVSFSDGRVARSAQARLKVATWLAGDGLRLSQSRGMPRAPRRVDGGRGGARRERARFIPSQESARAKSNVENQWREVASLSKFGRRVFHEWRAKAEAEACSAPS